VEQQVIAPTATPHDEPDVTYAFDEHGRLLRVTWHRDRTNSRLA
jgi:hypothetical protein